MTIPMQVLMWLLLVAVLCAFSSWMMMLNYGWGLWAAILFPPVVMIGGAILVSLLVYLFVRGQ